MFNTCFEQQKDSGESIYDSNSFNSESFEKMNSVYSITNTYTNSNEAFLFKPKKIPIKIILSENENDNLNVEVISTQNNSEQLDHTASLNFSPSQIQNFTENFIKFSNTNTSEVTMRKKLIILFPFFLKKLMRIFFLKDFFNNFINFIFIIFYSYFYHILINFHFT
jgi:hypothetical protein